MNATYRELLILDHDTNDQPDIYFACNICERRLDDNTHCPEHAPFNVPGLQIIACNNPAHPRMWMVETEGYPPPCMYCVHDDLQEAHAGCEHSHHGPWRRWRISRWLAGWAYALGILSGFAVGFNAHCSGCLHWFHWRGRRPYVLGWPRWKWSCVLRRRHWPATFIGLGCCSKCLPCPDCGSSTSCFDGGCDNTPGGAS